MEADFYALLARRDREGRAARTKLWRFWSEVIGREAAALVRPLGSRGSALIVGVEDNFAMQEAMFLFPELLSRVNAFVGGNGFDKVIPELIGSRPLLDEIRVHVDFPDVPHHRPEPLGKLLDRFPETTAIGRSYRAYVRAMGGEEAPGNDA